MDFADLKCLAAKKYTSSNAEPVQLTNSYGAVAALSVKTRVMVVYTAKAEPKAGINGNLERVSPFRANMTETLLIA